MGPVARAVAAFLWLAATADRAGAQESSGEVAPIPVERVEGPPAIAPDPLEAPPDVVDQPPTVDLRARVRDPLVALQDARYARVRRGAPPLIGAAALEAGAGLLVALTAGDDGSRRGAGIVLFAGGTTHGIQAYYQLDIAQRRHAAFLADLAAVEDRPEAWRDLAVSARLSAEREARNHALATGIYAGFVGAGLLPLLASDDQARTPGLALSIVGSIGLVHHVSRWRATVRLSHDFDGLVYAPPTVAPMVER